jgi:hypothetical protein
MAQRFAGKTDDCIADKGLQITAPHKPGRGNR